MSRLPNVRFPPFPAVTAIDTLRTLGPVAFPLPVCSGSELYAGNHKRPTAKLIGVSLLVLISAAASNPAITEKVAAIASVRIVKAVKVSEEAWRSHERRREQLFFDEQGRKRLLRLVEFE